MKRLIVNLTTYQLLEKVGLSKWDTLENALSTINPIQIVLMKIYITLKCVHKISVTLQSYLKRDHFKLNILLMRCHFILRGYGSDNDSHLKV